MERREKLTGTQIEAAYKKGRTDFTGVEACGTSLQGAALCGIGLEGAILQKICLRGANIPNADLRSANLEEACLDRAYLKEADLRWAQLAGARLQKADLSKADLRGADLKGADFWKATLDGAWLPDGVPIVHDLDAQILALIQSGKGRLDMEGWHTCETAHCLAGWAVHLAGEAGAQLEEEMGTAAAGTLIFQKSTGSFPDFYASNREGMEELLARVEVAGS